MLRVYQYAWKILAGIKYLLFQVVLLKPPAV